MKRKIVVAITGASGSIYAKRFLTHLINIDKTQNPTLEVGIILSKNAPDVWHFEMGDEDNFLNTLPDNFRKYDLGDYTAPFASGSARYLDMVIVPCSMGTLGRIAHGISDDLTGRAADVILKERRRLICIVRDTPYSLIHLENMLKITQAGAIILPASPSFYSRPQSFDALADTVVHRALDLMSLTIPDTYRWNEED